LTPPTHRTCGVSVTAAISAQRAACASEAAASLERGGGAAALDCHNGYAYGGQVSEGAPQHQLRIEQAAAGHIWIHPSNNQLRLHLRSHNSERPAVG
jgi:hypothetical protein